ncbi:hypothetical protein L207DRAFT_641787 [Hyaloscypha variabilis F]|uniref:Uncharacterized protein n=1 Tax=Hyaloscypha variabilis (strain UAMH 11265 / GT02V1 / F) TaxID=1149755 RepID=A0A2J6QVD3_HYAVF|nr:hypothetical protein L207DRAFT_641787 [Hyaloscypha variabilis F]
MATPKNTEASGKSTAEIQKGPEESLSQAAARRNAQVGLATYRTARHVQRLHSHASKIAGIFDPSFNDYGDADDDDSDMELDSDEDNDTDNDDDSIYSQHEDDQSIHDEDDSTAQAKDNDTAAHSSKLGPSSEIHGLSGTRAALPVTRVSKPSELTTNISSDPASSPKPVAVTRLTPATTKATIPAPAPAPASTRIEEVKPAAFTQPEAVPTRIIKVRKPDGTIVRVRRPIKPTPIAGEPKSASEATKFKAEAAKQVTPGIKNGQPTATSEPSKEVKPSVVVIEKEKNDDLSSHDLLKSPPSSATKLARRTSKAAQITIWTIMISVPLVFLILGILTAVVTGESENSSLGKAITQGNRVAVSLWPIVYAAIAAQVLRMYASYKVERGLRLMTLEQLISSHSLASAIKQPFLLQRLNWVSIALLCLWSLSPLAGQAFLRMSYLAPSGVVHNTTLQYLDTAVDPAGFDGAADAGAFGPNVDILYGSLILSPIASQQSSMDSWGNPKIPIISELNKTNSKGWSMVPSLPSYSSLLGVPVSGLTKNGGNTAFKIESAYFAFEECLPMTNITLEEVISTIAADPLAGSLENATSATLHMAIALPSANNNTNGTIYYASKLGSNDAYAYTSCPFSQVFVSTTIFCTGLSCSASLMLAATNSHPAGLISSASYLNMILNFVNSGAAKESDIYTPTQFYIQDPGSAGMNDFTTGPDPRVISPANFTARLAILLNSYWLAGIAPYDFTGTIKSDSNAVTPVSIQGTSTDTALVYHTSWGWLVVLLFSALLLLGGGMAGAVLDHLTVGPDIFGFASSLVHRNKYMKLEDEENRKGATGTIGGAQKARTYGHVKVMLMDVRPGQEVGRIALGRAESGVMEGRLKRGRLYK